MPEDSTLVGQTAKQGSVDETGLNRYLPCFTVYHFSKTILNLPQNYYPQNIERESSERQKAMADLPHMKRFKTNMKRRRIKQILQDVTGSPCVFCILKLLLDSTLLNFVVSNYSCLYLDDEAGEKSKNNKKRKRVILIHTVDSQKKSNKNI